MRTFITAALAAAALLPVAAQAQSYGEVRHDQRELRHDRQQVQDAQRYGDRGDVRDARREFREDRQERNEDWRDYRRTHGDVYRRGGYQGPRGYRYRPVGVGYRFQPGFYDRRYWVNDYGNYRLPRPAYGYQRWVRYGNDVVLVDIRNGGVARVFNGFFY